MTPRTAHRLVRFAAAAVFASAALAGSNGNASAGGWAVGSLDAMPAATAAATTEVGFTILQHGVHPAAVDGEVGIEIRDDGGTQEFFPAVGEGATGHYVATVTFPEVAGSYSWNVRMGWFGAYELGTLDVGVPEPASTGTWMTFRWFTLGGSLLLAGIAIADLVVSRHRRVAVG